jgi:hypothetical protein
MPSARSRVFVSAAEILVPPNFGLTQLTEHILRPRGFLVPAIKNNWPEMAVESYQLQLDPAQRHHPSPRDTKSMRLDVIAMCVCLGRMLEKFQSTEGWADVPIFMSTGPNASGMASEIESIYDLMLAHINSEAGVRNQQVYSEIHPLFALRGLTNSAQAYAAQLFGFRGQNATYGSTSYGTFSAFADAVAGLQAGEYHRTVIGASNGGGLIAQLMNSGLCPWGKNFRESTMAVSLILETEEGLRQRQGNALVEVMDVSAGSRLPELEGIQLGDIYQEFNKCSGSSAVFSGGPCDESFAAEQKEVQSHWKTNWSAYPLLGGGGCASFLLNIALACEMIEQKATSIVDCLDRDFYSRESRVELRGLE